MAIQRVFDFQQQVQSLEADLMSFREFGQITEIVARGDLKVFVNEFWTSKQRQANRLHEVSYRACFKPHLPRFFIERLTRPGDIVYDPFMGRGTTQIEAALLGRIPYGNDANPLSKALCGPRLSPPGLKSVTARLSQIPWHEFKRFARDDLLAFYHPTTLTHIEGLRQWFLNRVANGEFDQVDAWIRMVAINRLTGHSSGFFSVYTLPPNQAVKVERQLKINAKRDQIPPERDVPAIILKKSRSLLGDGPLPNSEGLLLTGPSEHTPQIKSGTVSLTVTSPPFLDIVDYEGDNWLRGWFLGVDPDSVTIASHRKIDDWRAFTASTLKELARVTRQGGHIAYEVGEVRNGTIKLEDTVIEAALGLPLEPIGVMINQQDFTKTSNCWGVSNNTSGTNSNRIVVFRKAAE